MYLIFPYDNELLETLQRFYLKSCSIFVSSKLYLTLVCKRSIYIHWNQPHKSCNPIIHSRNLNSLFGQGLEPYCTVDEYLSRLYILTHVHIYIDLCYIHYLTVCSERNVICHMGIQTSVC